MTEEQKNTLLINKLQESVVYVEHFVASGSGVIIKHENNKTIILTNKHVIENAPNTGVRAVNIEELKI